MLWTVPSFHSANILLWLLSLLDSGGYTFWIFFPILHLCLFWMWNKTLTVCSYYITYAFQSESTLYSCLNIKELLARSMREISSLWDYNGTQTHNHLVRKRVPLQSHEIKHFFHVITLWILPKLYRLTKNNLK